MFMSSSGALHNLSHVDVPYCYLTFSELSVNFGNTLQLFRYLFFLICFITLACLLFRLVALNSVSPADLSSVPVIFEMGH